MPTVVIEGRFRFVINTRENRFEPPHVHVWVDNQDTCRIMAAYRKNSQEIREIWETIHGE